MFRTDLTTQFEATDCQALRNADHLRALAVADRAAIADGRITVRVLDDGDTDRLDRLAGRDSGEVPPGRLLGAEVNGRLVAAISLTNARTVADPFSTTAAAVELLRLRARQLGGGKRRRFPRLHPPAGRPHARGSLAGSPPGAAGNLLQL